MLLELTAFLYFLKFISTYTNFVLHSECQQRPLSIVEFYQKNDILFLLFSQPVSWFEARSICITYEASLSITSSEEKNAFIGLSLSESNLRASSFWVGAKKEDWEWVWMDGQLVTDQQILLPWFQLKNYSGDCLGAEKAENRSIALVTYRCHFLKPFICERVLTARTSKPLPSLPTQWIQIKDRIFTFYHSKISWIDGLAFCRTLGQRLAIIPNLKVAGLLAGAMLRSRPSMDSIWIGGYFYLDSWMWVSTGETFSTDDVSEDYPPWSSDNKTEGGKMCLLFDRHMTSFYFVPSKCKKLKDVLCEQYPRDPVDYKESFQCTSDSTTMHIFLDQKNWMKANQACNGNGMILAEPKDQKTARAISACLGDLPVEIGHVWLGGMHEGKRWVWHSTSKEIGNSLPWLIEPFDKDSLCLNMDRINHNELYMYGLNCDEEQAFVCEMIR